MAMYLELLKACCQALFRGCPTNIWANSEPKPQPPIRFRVANSDAGSTFTPGPMVEEIATRLM